MKIYKIIAIIISSIIGISATIWLIWGNSMLKAAFSNSGSATQEDYQILKNYVYQISKNPDFEIPDDILVEQEVLEDVLKIHVNKSFNHVKASFPILSWDEKIKNGEIQRNGIIDYNNVTYYEYNDVKPIPHYILMLLIFLCICTCASFASIYLFPVLYMEAYKEEKKLTKENKEDDSSK